MRVMVHYYKFTISTLLGNINKCDILEYLKHIHFDKLTIQMLKLYHRLYDLNMFEIITVGMGSFTMASHDTIVRQASTKVKVTFYYLSC